MDLEQLLKSLGLEGENLDKGKDALTAVVDAAVKKAVEKTAAEAAERERGLKANHDKLLDEKKKTEAVLESLGDIDQLRQIKELVEKDEDLKLVRDGKVGELVEKKTKALVQTHQQQMAEVNRTREETELKFKALDQRWRGERLQNAVARAVAGLHEGAISEVQRMAPDYFVVNDTGDIETREGAEVWQDGRPVTLQSFNDYLKASKPYLYPGSAGSGAPGSGGSPGSQRVIPASEAGKNLKALADGTARLAAG